MKIWIIYREFQDLRTGEVNSDWWLNKKEEGAKKGFEAELEAYYEQYGKYKKQSYASYHQEEGLIQLEVPGDHKFLLLYQEEPVL